jgi:hypothetical protein
MKARQSFVSSAAPAWRANAKLATLLPYCNLDFVQTAASD